MRQTQQHTRLSGLAVGGLILAAILLLAGCSLGAGAGWEQAGSTDGHIVLSLAADPFLKQVYAGTDGGMVYRLRMDGSSTPLASEGLPKDAVIGAILPDAHTQGLVYAGGSRGLYVTTDSGAHWQSRGTGFPADDTMGALIAGSDPQTLIAGSHEHGIYITHDKGTLWQSASAGMPGNANIYTLFGDRTSHTVYAAVDGVGVFASTDEGGSWSQRSSGLPVHVFALAELPTRGLNPSGATLYAGTEQGLYASVDAGAHWALTGSLLATNRVLSLAADPSTPGTLYAGTDVTVLQSSDGGRNWHGIASGLNGHIASLLVVRGVIFAGTNELVRYPPRGGASVATTIINLLFLLALGAAGFFVLRRSRIRFQQMERQTHREVAERMARERPWSVRNRSGESQVAADDTVGKRATSEDATSATDLEGHPNERMQ